MHIRILCVTLFPLLAAALAWAPDLAASEGAEAGIDAAALAVRSEDATLLTTFTPETFKSLLEAKLPPELRMPAVAAEDRFTRDAAVKTALADNAGLKAARDQIDVARGDYRHSSAANNPLFQIGGSWIPNVQESDSSSLQDQPDRDISFLQYTFPTSGRRRHSTAAAGGRFQTAVATYRGAELDLSLAVSSAYADLEQSQENVALNEDLTRIAITFTDLARRQLEAGAIPQTSVIGLEIQQEAAEQALAQAHYDLLTKEEALAFQMGRAPGRRLGAADPLDERRIQGTLDELIHQALANRPEVIAAAATVKGLRSGVRLAADDRRPDLTVQTTADSRPANSGGAPWTAWISLPLWDRGQIGGNVQQARANLHAAEHTLELVRRQVQSDAIKAYQQVMSTEHVLAVYRDLMMPKTRLLLEKTRLSYQAGSATMLDVLNAQQQYRQTSIAYLGSSGDHTRAIATLERAIAAAVAREPGPVKTYRRGHD